MSTRAFSRAGRAAVLSAFRPRVPILLCVVMCVGPTGVASASELNLSGTWNANYHCEVGSCAGHDYPAPGVKFIQAPGSSHVEIPPSASGTLIGNILTINGEEGSYKYKETLTISADGNSWSGSLSDSNGTSGTDTGKRISGPPGSEEAAAKAAKERKEAEERAAKRPSVTQVSCYYDFATSIDTCTAQVADTGTPPTTVPGGTVSFTSTDTGSFPNGSTCTLAASAEAPSIPFCSVTYHPANSNLPSITAAYSGDPKHEGSQGHTVFFEFGLQETAETLAAAPKGQLPSEVTIQTNVPANGTTVETSADAQTEPIKNPPDSNSPLGQALHAVPTIPDVGLAPVWVSVLENLREEIKTVAFAANQTDAWARLMRSVDLSYEYAHHLIEDGNAAYRLEGEQLRALTSKLGSALIPIAEAMRGEPTGQPSARKSTSGMTAKAKRAKPRNPFTLLASITHRNAHHGKLKVKLHLNRTLLRQLTGKHKRLTIYIWLRLTLPSKVRPSGVKLIVVKPLTLRRR